MNNCNSTWHQVQYDMTRWKFGYFEALNPFIGSSTFFYGLKVLYDDSTTIQSQLCKFESTDSRP